MNWLTLALLSAAFFTASNLLIKFYQPRLGIGLSLMYFILGGLITGGILTFIVKIGDPAVKQVGNAPLIAMAAGLLWAVASVLMFQLIAKNAPLSIALPLVVGGIGVGGALGGFFIFGEQMTMARVFAVGLVLVGSVLLARS